MSSVGQAASMYGLESSGSGTSARQDRGGRFAEPATSAAAQETVRVVWRTQAASPADQVRLVVQDARRAVRALRPITQRVLSGVSRFSQQLRGEFPDGATAAERRLTAFEHLVGYLAAAGKLEIWPEPVVASSESAILLSWTDDHGHLELEINDDGEIEVFSMLRDAGLPGAQNLEFSNESAAYERIVEALCDAGARLFEAPETR